MHEPERVPGARLDLCRFLAACYCEPEAAFAEERLFESMQAAAALLDADLSANAHRLADAFEQEDLLALRVDYTRLFLGPVQPLARPYGSSWLNSAPAAEQDPTHEVVDLYRQCGFDLDESLQDLPDHVAVELEFLYLLIGRQNEARQAGDDDAASVAVLLQRRFLANHLGAWIGPFAAAVRAGAQTAFYRELADLTEAFLHLQDAAARPH